ncbi:hypothetical protein Scep_010771 [Stephania cephalantha]|uniref:Gag protein n=1 Tax=Stephania cephalantha TaxID=152367 RepID=A0AAP0JXZ1_9MAGN
MNYTYWKARIEGYILSIDVKAWRSIEKGYEPPEVDGEPKTPDDWTTDEEKLLLADAKGLNAIFEAVNQEHLKLISLCRAAMEAWEILENFFEGN